MEREKNSKLTLMVLEILQNLFDIKNSSEIRNAFVQKNGLLYLEKLEISIDNEVCLLSERILNNYFNNI